MTFIDTGDRPDMMVPVKKSRARFILQWVSDRRMEKLQQTSINKSFYACIYPSPSLTSRLCHMVNFEVVYSWFEFSLASRPVAL